MLLDGALLLRRSETLLLRAEAACISYLSEEPCPKRLGCSSTAVLARERLGIAERTRQERVLLHRTLAVWPEIERVFLEGRVSACQVVALAPVRGEPEEERQRWLAEARALTVRELKHRVRAWKIEARAGAEGEDSDPDDERLFEFTAPVGFVGVWEETADLARRVLGSEAPRAQCLEAILQEAGYRGLTAARPKRPQGLGPLRPLRRLPILHLPPREEAVAEAVGLLREVERTLASLRHVIEAREPPDERDALARYEDLQRRHRPLRLLLARILRRLGELRAVERLGYAHLRDLAEERLGLSERSARNLVREAYLAEDEPLLARAYALGALGSLAFTLIPRVARGDSRGAWLQRAREVNYRQLEREVGFFERLWIADRQLASRFSGPFPMPGFEEALVEKLREVTARKGRTGEDGSASSWAEFDSDLRRLGIGPIASSETDDPAEDPDLQRRLEALLAWLLARSWEELPRQTFAHHPREVHLRWVLPADLAADLRGAVERIRAKQGAPLPAWIALALLFDSACRQWSEHDPTSKPVWWRILERDEYRCQAPGCTRRGNLMAHHICFRSHGGCNRAWNLIVLCHICHQRLLHEGWIALRGRAPSALDWEVGCSPGRRSLLRLRGEKILERAYG